MRESLRSLTRSLTSVLTCIIIPLSASGVDDAVLTKEQIKVFLQTAPVINKKASSKGVTHPWRLTLSDGTITHDASFQPIDEHKPEMKLESGKVEFGFVDSYKYNIAAYQLSELIGLDDMLPVYVERKWEGKTGSLSWWLPVKMDEADRVAKKIVAPDTDKWNKQMYRIRVFDELVYDTDPNLTNVLIGEDWTVWRIDFSRAFRTSKDVRDPKDLVERLQAGLEDGGKSTAPVFPNEVEALEWMLAESAPNEVVAITALGQRPEIFQLLRARGGAAVGPARLRQLVQRARR